MNKVQTNKKNLRNHFPNGLVTELDFVKNRFKLSYCGFSLTLGINEANHRLELSLGYPINGLLKS